MREIYISTDIEADGPIPGPHSMLSIGAAAYTADKVLVSTFSTNLETLPGALPHPKTAAWWATQPEAWAACRKDLEPPERAMTRYVTWLKSLEGKPVFVAYPAGFDFLFVYWYLMKFVGESPFSHSALDIKSFAMAMLKTNYRDSTKRNMPKHWFDALPHTHIALGDADAPVDRIAVFLDGNAYLFCVFHACTPIDRPEPVQLQRPISMI